MSTESLSKTALPLMGGSRLWRYYKPLFITASKNVQANSKDKTKSVFVSGLWLECFYPVQARKALADRQRELELKTQQLENKLTNKTEEEIKKARRKSTQAGQGKGRCGVRVSAEVIVFLALPERLLLIYAARLLWSQRLDNSDCLALLWRCAGYGLCILSFLSFLLKLSY